MGIVAGATVPVLVVRTEAEHLGRRPQGREDQVLDPDGRGGHPALVAEVPEGGAELQGVLGRPPGGRPPVGHQAGQGLVELLGVEGRTELDHAGDLDVPRFPSEWGTPAGTTMVSPALAVIGSPSRVKAASPGDDGEPLLLVGVDVLGDHPTGHAAPVEADEFTVAVLGHGGVLDPLAGGGLKKGWKVVIDRTSSRRT